MQQEPKIALFKMANSYITYLYLCAYTVSALPDTNCYDYVKQIFIRLYYCIRLQRQASWQKNSFTLYDERLASPLTHTAIKPVISLPRFPVASIVYSDELKRNQILNTAKILLYGVQSCARRLLRKVQRQPNELRVDLAVCTTLWHRCWWRLLVVASQLRAQDVAIFKSTDFQCLSLHSLTSCSCTQPTRTRDSVRAKAVSRQNAAATFLLSVFV